MSPAELDSMRRQLEALRSRLNGDVSHLTDEALRTAGGDTNGNLSNTPIHMADLGTDNFEHEFTLGLIENQEQMLGEINEALERMSKGTYGRCEECGKVIPRARLQALPYARHCVECARKTQQSG